MVSCKRICLSLILAVIKAAILVVHTNLAGGRSDPYGWCSGANFIDCHSLKNRFHESNETALKVIAPSYGQTGTTTVMDAMREMGLRSYHADDFSVMAKGVMFDLKDPTFWANTVSRCRMEAISLEPISDAFPMALDVSPQAKVIMTWRDFPAWIRSTTQSGAPKDQRTSLVMSVATGAKNVYNWLEVFDFATGLITNARLQGNPMRQPLDIFSYVYRLACNGYAWPINDVYNRGIYKAAGSEEAYIAHIDEIRRLTPPGRLLEFNVKKHTWKELEEFLGVPISGKTRLPQHRSKNSRTNDVFLDNYRHISVPALLFFCGLHAANYLISSAILIGLPLYLLQLCCCCSSREPRTPTPAAPAPPAAPAGPATSAASAAPAAPVASRDPGPTSSPELATTAEGRFRQALSSCPVVAILRGVVPQQVLGIGKALVEAGVTIIEIPLNSPDALESIRILAKGLPVNIVIGAGTVLTEDDVVRVEEAGGTIVVSPNLNEKVVRKTRALGLVSLPGVATPTEALAALEYGATGLKAFPAEQMPPKILKAWRAILPQGSLLLAVGGVTTDNMAEYWSAGVSGFGVGTALFRPGDEASAVRSRAGTFLAAVPH